MGGSITPANAAGAWEKEVSCGGKTWRKPHEPPSRPLQRRLALLVSCAHPKETESFVSCASVTSSTQTRQRGWKPGLGNGDKKLHDARGTVSGCFSGSRGHGTHHRR